MKPEYFICDVDGCLTDGNFFYTLEGKVMKRFGADDCNMLKKFQSLVPDITIEFATCDWRGWDISKLRCNDMGFKCHVISGHRLDWMKQNYDMSKVVFMGDEISDIPTMKEVMYSICPTNSFDIVKYYADYVTNRNGGSGALTEALIHIYDKFFNVTKKIGYEIFSE